VLAEGRTAYAFQFGAGGEIPLGERSLLRLEVGDLVVRYPGPAFAENEVVLQDSFWRHHLRAGVSVGLRF
jgi:hypothetical protein